MLRMLLLGGSGQLGTAIRATSGTDWVIDAPSSADVDLSNAEALGAYCRQTKPEVIVNAAAYTRVDDAEAERDLAFRINAEAPGVIATAARELDARLVHLSTDYVFDGNGPHPYRTTSPTNPLSVYGASKLAGEQAVGAANPSALTVRTSWVHSGTGVNFVATAVGMLSQGKSMRVVDDQVGTPTRATNLARAVLALAGRRDVRGVLHFTDAGVASWYDVACCVLETLRASSRAPHGMDVTPIDSSAMSRPAKRPAISILDTRDARRILGWTPPHWREGVRASAMEMLGL